MALSIYLRPLSSGRVTPAQPHVHIGIIFVTHALSADLGLSPQSGISRVTQVWQATSVPSPPRLLRCAGRLPLALHTIHLVGVNPDVLTGGSTVAMLAAAAAALCH